MDKLEFKKGKDLEKPSGFLTQETGLKSETLAIQSQSILESTLDMEAIQPDTPKPTMICDYCQKHFQSKTGFTNHVKKEICRKNKYSKSEMNEDTLQTCRSHCQDCGSEFGTWERTVDLLVFTSNGPLSLLCDQSKYNWQLPPCFK